MKRPSTFGPMAHGAVESPLFFKGAKNTWPENGIIIPASCDGKNAAAHYYDPKRIRQLGMWCLKIADYMEKKAARKVSK